MPHKPSPSVDKGSIVFLGVSTAAAAQEKVQTKKNGAPMVVEVKPLPASTQMDVEAQLSGDALEDGFRLWLVVFGAFCCTFATFGYVNTWGVFQAYYQEVILSDSREASIAWIGAIQYSLLFLPGLVTERFINPQFLRPILIGASVLLLTCTFLIPECTGYGHFLLCQGIATGLACGMFFVPVATMVDRLFKSRKGLPLTLLMIGSSVGGTVFPITLRELLPRVGFAWTVRIVGFVMLFFLLLGNMTLRVRLPTTLLAGSQTSSASELIAASRLPSQALHCLSMFLVFSGFFTLLTYVASKSHSSLGDFAFYLVAVINASSGLGTILFGLLAERSKFASTLAIPLAGIAAAATYAWPFALARSEACLIVVCVIYGLSISSLSQPDSGILPLIARALGSLLGAPLAGYVGQTSGVGMGVFSGSVLMSGILTMCLTRFLMLRERK